MPFQWTLYQKRMHTGALIFTKALNEGMKYEETPRHAPDMVHLTDVNKQMNEQRKKQPKRGERKAVFCKI